jgi:alpha-mannosidase
VLGSRDGYSACVSNIGLREYEILKGNTIALTLLRCVGWLSRGDFAYRSDNAGPMMETPEGQMPGTRTLRYAFSAGLGFLPVTQANLFRNGVSTRYTDTERNGVPLPSELAFASIEPESVVLAALKKAETDDGTIMRLFSLADREVEAVVTLARDFRKAHAVNLLEERIPGGVSASETDSFRVRIKPNEVVTFKILL